MKADILPRWVSFAVWAAAAASVVFWGLRLTAPSMPVPSQAAGVAGAQALRGDPLRVLGEPDTAPVAAPVVAAAPARFKLVGVVAPKASQAAPEGLAVIVIDSKPARAYRVGATVEGDLVLQRVHQRGADLGARGASQPSMALELPRPAAAATGTLPSIGAPSAPAVPGQPVIAPAPVPQALPVEGQPDADGAPERQPGDEPPRPSLPGRPGTVTY